MDDAYDNGLFSVMLAHNYAHRFSSACSTNDRATRSDVLVVGGFGNSGDYSSSALLWNSFTDLNAQFDRCPNTQSDDDPTLCLSSAEGGADLYAGGGEQSRARTIVDVTAPGGRAHSALRDVFGNNVYESVGTGTSISAPKATAAAVSIRDWGYEFGHSLWENPTMIYVMMLSGGDYTGEYGMSGSDPMDQEAERPEGSYSTRQGFSRIWGAGRMQVHRLNTLGDEGGTLESPWGWRAGEETLSVPLPEWNRLSSSTTPAGTEEIAGIFAWDEPALSGESDDLAAYISMGLYSDAPDSNGECPQEPTSSDPTFLAEDDSWDTKRRIALGPDFVVGNSDVIGECIYMKIHNHSALSREGAYVMYRQGG